MARHRNIITLTGALLSAESGLGKFRAPAASDRTSRSKTWRCRKPSSVILYAFTTSTISAADCTPRRTQRCLCRPCQGRAGAWWKRADRDPEHRRLHEAAGARRLIHMHGELERALCAACGTSAACKEDLSTESLSVQLAAKPPCAPTWCGLGRCRGRWNASMKRSPLVTCSSPSARAAQVTRQQTSCSRSGRWRPYR